MRSSEYLQTCRGYGPFFSFLGASILKNLSQFSKIFQLSLAFLNFPIIYYQSMMQNLSSTDSRALTLLGQGLDPSVVASAIGVTPSYISQLLSNAEFSSEVAEARFLSLAKHSERDSNYDKIEDQLLKKLENCLPFMLRPMEVLAAIKVINAAKRRSTDAPASMQQKAPVIQLVLPTQIIQQFKVNGNNQVVQAGEQELVTAQASQLKNMLTQVENAHTILPALPHTETPNVLVQSAPKQSVSASG